MNQLWQSISEKLLYRSIVTDDLPLLLADVGQSYRQRQLGLTRHLYVEYCVKGRGPTYEDLIGKGGELWPAVGLWGVELEAAQREECRPEVAAMEQVLTKLVKVGANTVFKRLLSLAVSSIYGDVYNKIFRGQPETEYNRVLSFGGAINLNSARAFRLFIQASNLRHLCIRDQRGKSSILPDNKLISRSIELPSHFLRLPSPQKEGPPHSHPTFQPECRLPPLHIRHANAMGQRNFAGLELPLNKPNGVELSPGCD